MDALVWLGAVGAILFLGPALSRRVDELASVTGLGRALMGAVLLGATTSLPGLVASMDAASAGRAELAVSNAVGGIAAQTTFIAIADLFYRRNNLEYGGADVGNLVNASALMLLLSIPVTAEASPNLTFLRLHPGSWAILGVYLGCLVLGRRLASKPSWKPTGRIEAVEAAPKERALGIRIVEILALVVVVAVAGWGISVQSQGLVASGGWSEQVVGTFVSGVLTSLPELVIAVSAARSGKGALAMATIIGGNAFDMCFIAASDFTLGPASIYHPLGAELRLSLGLASLLNGVLLLGMLVREEKGLGNIGLEGPIILLVYSGGLALSLLAGAA